MTSSSSPVESVFRPAFVLMSGRVLGFAAAFAIPMVLARVFDQSEFGTYKQLFLVYSSLYSVVQLGMAESLFYFLPSNQKQGGSTFPMPCSRWGFRCDLFPGLVGRPIAHCPVAQ